MTTALELHGISKSYGDLHVLRDLDLTVDRGAFVSILGRSGEGKTTLLRLIAGFEAPDAGSIRLGDRLVHDDGVHIPAERRRVGIVPQEAALFPHLTAADNVAFGLHEWKPNRRHDRVCELLDLVDMRAFADYLPSQLSGGQQRRIAVARALAPNPDLVLLDEPFAALDSEMRRRLRDDVRNVLGKVGATALLVTHDQEEALSIADSVAILRDGAIAQQDRPRAIYSTPADLQMASFIVDSVVLDATIVDGKAETALGALQLQSPVIDGARGHVAIRPENLYLQPHPDGDGVVVGRQYFGHDSLVEVALDALTVYARTSSPLTPEKGARVSVWVRGPVSFFAA